MDTNSCLHLLRPLATAGLIGVLIVTSGGIAAAKPGNGNGKAKHVAAHEKVRLCHKGRFFIAVGAPAARAHVAHGDMRGACVRAQAEPPTTTIAVFKHVVNDDGGTKTASDFTLTIGGVTVPAGKTFGGSERGATKLVTSFGRYSVTEAPAAGYVRARVSAGCSGTIEPGDHVTCVIVNDDLPSS